MPEDSSPIMQGDGEQRSAARGVAQHVASLDLSNEAASSEYHQSTGSKGDSIITCLHLPVLLHKAVCRMQIAT